MKSAITKLSFSLVDYCNINCKYCFVDAKNKGNQLDFNHAIKFIEYMAPRIRPKATIHLTGGEPTLYPKIIPLIKQLKEILIDPNIMINTNGTFSEKLRSDLLDLGVVFYMTFEGLPEMQNFERPFYDGSGTAEVVSKNIKKICEVSTDNLIIRLNLSKNKMGKQKEIVEYLKSLGVVRLSSGYLTKTGRGKTYEHADPIYCTTGAPEFYKESVDGGLLSEMPKFLPRKNAWFPCGAGEKLFALTVDSKIVACPNLLSSKDLVGREVFILGEVSDEVRLDLSSMKAFKDFAEQVPDSCNNCLANGICGGCPLERTLENPLVFKDEHCKFHRANVTAFRTSGLNL